MAHVFYTAKRSVMAAHSIGTEYEIEVGLNRFDRSTKREQETSKSLSGLRFTVLHHIDTFYDVSTVPLKSESLIEQMQEFLDSVAGGESFTLDVYGAIGAPDNPRTFLVDGDYTKTMVDISGFYSFQFKVVEA